MKLLDFIFKLKLLAQSNIFTREEKYIRICVVQRSILTTSWYRQVKMLVSVSSHRTNAPSACRGNFRCSYRTTVLGVVVDDFAVVVVGVAGDVALRIVTPWKVASRPKSPGPKLDRRCYCCRAGSRKSCVLIIFHPWNVSSHPCISQ